MIKYLVVHCKHEGCYDFQCYDDEEKNIRLTSIRINPPKIFMFETKEAAHDFFCDYITDVDNMDPRCKKGQDVEHLEYCTCGIMDVDDDGNPVLFYNKKNQIFLLENSSQLFSVSQNMNNQIINMNETNKVIRKYRNLDNEQRQKYIELGELCKECITNEENGTLNDDDIPKK